MQVIDQSKLNFFLEEKVKEREAQILQEDDISVSVDPTDNQNLFRVRFSREIALPVNCSSWTSINEGMDRLSVQYQPSQETQTIMYDEDVTIDMFWRVVKVNIKKWISTINTDTTAQSSDLKRNLQDIKERPLGLVASEELADFEGQIDVNYFEVKFEFNLPEIVSR